ncbi:hypothetical protein [Paraferrimonas sedimenticola]|uniref:Cytochrome c domain-containing protein n=1 Tax=Paraferrimonas sedimenticola TaxID=375674 RepID=A0AA37W1J0_9GAMM|nr:hypothetical protein [Paraferrimonas sedimenticola]GLP96853.1 hypothetical protein GCM10007895_21590 [Paraferrimonas sedimenticola]
MRYYSTAAVLLCGLLAGCGGEETIENPLQPTPEELEVSPNNFLQYVNRGLYDPQVFATTIDSAGYAEAYYKVVDADGSRTTFPGWQQANGFNEATDVINASFRDVNDLGYGRDMFAWKWQHLDANGMECTNTSFFVVNYVVEVIDGDASAYGPLNLDALIAQDKDFHFGTNAIEFSPIDMNDCSSRKILKFFTFSPSGDQQRLVKVNLDGRGEKYMPTTCIICHGGYAYPPLPNGEFDPVTLHSPQFVMLQPDTFQYSDMSNYTYADQAPNIQAINQLVYDSYVEAGQYQDIGSWNNEFAKERIEAAYQVKTNDEGSPVFSAYCPDCIPSGWQQNDTRPEGVERLYTQVLKPHCLGCHSLLGTNAAQERDKNIITFSSYEAFATYASGLNVELLTDYIFKRGVMPASLISNDSFWNSPEQKAGLLASFIKEFDVISPQGEITTPGSAFARPGGDRRQPSPVQLDGRASYFSTGYQWQITSSDPSASLQNADTATPTLTADDGAEVELQLVTSNSTGNSEPQRFTVTIDNSAAIPTSFQQIYDEVLNEGQRCTVCHQSNYASNMPVYYLVEGERQLSDVYRSVLARVDLVEPENSLLLRKPSNAPLHGGEEVLPIDSEEYQKVLRWIRAGAPQ